MAEPTDVSAHDTRGSLLDAIRSGLERSGVDLSRATVDDLSAVDEFHTGGRVATRALCAQLDVGGADRVVDLGCGIGGTARHLARDTGCSVVGVDVTPEYVHVATTLSDWTGLSDRTELASALDTGLPEDSFDVAVLVHVGMNIADKGALFAEVHRLLRPGGRFGVYDIMRTAPGDIRYPVPWASNGSMSHVAPLEVYLDALRDAGFALVTHRDRGDFARDLYAGQSRPRDGDRPPLGPHVIMGDDVGIEAANVVAAVTTGASAPTEVVARKPRRVDRSTGRRGFGGVPRRRTITATSTATTPSAIVAPPGNV